MYNNSKAECVVGLLTPGCAPRLPVYRTASGSFQVDAMRVGPAACVVRIQDHTFIEDHNGQLLKASWNGLRSYQIKIPDDLYPADY
jgi:hypothetical protein